MSNPTEERTPYTQSVDVLFSHLSNGGAGERPTPAQPEPPARVEDQPQPAPPAFRSAETQAEHHWLQEERRRLEAYTHNQFGALKQQHDALLARRFEIEEKLALQGQEINREMNLLSARRDVLQRHEQELAGREQALHHQLAELAHAEHQLTTFRQKCEQVKQEIEEHQAVLEPLQAERARLEEENRTARAGLEAREAEHNQRRQALDEEHARLSASRKQVEQRYEALAEAEQRLDRRMREEEELEARVRRDAEQRVRELEAECERRRHEQAGARAGDVIGPDADDRARRLDRETTERLLEWEEREAHLVAELRRKQEEAEAALEKRVRQAAEREAGLAEREKRAEGIEARQAQSARQLEEQGALLRAEIEQARTREEELRAQLLEQQSRASGPKPADAWKQEAEAEYQLRLRELEEREARLLHELEEREKELEVESRRLEMARLRSDANLVVPAIPDGADPSLSELINAWPRLPDYARQTLLMLVANTP